MGAKSDSGSLCAAGREWTHLQAVHAHRACPQRIYHARNYQQLYAEQRVL